LRGIQRYAQGDQHVDFASGALRGLGERREERQTLPEMGNRFDMGGALDSALSCELPIGDCLLCQPCLGIMLRQEFGLYLSGLGELGFQDLGNPLVILLSRTL
jgi:hypothetical protein